MKTPSNDLEIFLYRRQRLENMLKELENEIPEINHTITIKEESDIDSQLPSKFVSKSEKAIKPFKLLYVFENDLRDQIRSILQEKYLDKDWYQEIKLNQSTREEINKRVKNEKDTISSSRINDDVLVFCTLPELLSILLENWELFDESFPRGQRFTEKIIREINRYRVVVAHMSDLDEMDARTLNDLIYRFYNPF